jgi:hypothetical protein
MEHSDSEDAAVLSLLLFRDAAGFSSEQSMQDFSTSSDYPWKQSWLAVANTEKIVQGCSPCNVETNIRPANAEVAPALTVV